MRHHYKGFVLFAGGLIFAIILSRSSFLQPFVLHLGAYGYLGAFIAGVLFTSTFTMPTAIVILIALAHYLSAIEISLIAGVGATLGNYVIFLLINQKVTRHIRRYYKNKKAHKHHKALSPYAHFFIPFLGILILASPFPDEIGIFLLSIFKMRTHHFLLLSFLMKFISVFIFITTLSYIF